MPFIVAQNLPFEVAQVVIGILVVLVIGFLITLIKCYRKVLQGQALIRNGVGGTQVSFSFFAAIKRDFLSALRALKGNFKIALSRGSFFLRK